MTHVKNDLVFDIGVNKGEDALFYLEKGFRVVGIEADPRTACIAESKLRQFIVSGQLILLQKGIWSQAQTIPFYRNVDNDHWSSFNKDYGSRGGTRYEVVEVECITLRCLFRHFGIPRYLKVDVEGADTHVVRALNDEIIKPLYVSVEEYGVSTMDDLHEAGYDRFQLVPQRTKSPPSPPLPAREGKYVERTFTGYDSGTFGLELPPTWLSYKDVRAYFIDNIRNESGHYVGTEYEWHDVHATFSRRALSR